MMEANVRGKLGDHSSALISLRRVGEVGWRRKEGGRERDKSERGSEGVREGLLGGRKEEQRLVGVGGGKENTNRRGDLASPYFLACHGNKTTMSSLILTP